MTQTLKMSVAAFALMASGAWAAQDSIIIGMQL